MSDGRTQIYELYLAAWSAIPDGKRTRMLKESLSENIAFTNPQHTRRGLPEVAEHLRGFQVRSPGGSFRINSMVDWATYALAEWQLVDAKET